MAAGSAGGKPKPFVWKSVASEDGSAPDGRWGHSLNLVNQRYVVISGGIQAGRIFSDTWVYDFTTRKWGRCLTSGPGPSARWGHSATQINAHTLLVMGGREGSKPAPMSEYYELNLRTMTWTRRNTSEPAPKARYAHGALLLAGSPKQLLIFGGHGGRSRYYNDTVVLSLLNDSGTVVDPPGLQRFPGQTTSGPLETLASYLPGFARSQEQQPNVDDPTQARWFVPALTGNPPSKRSSFAFTMVGTNAFVIGGYDGKDILTEIGILHTTSWTWSKPLVGGSGIPPLVGHTAEHVEGTNQIVIFGGGVSALELSCSIYLLDAESCSSTIFTQPVAPPARFWHRAAIHKRADQTGDEKLKMLIFGGAGESGQAYNDLIEVDVTALADGDGLGESVALGLLQPAFSLTKSAEEDGAEVMRAGAVTGGPTTLRASALSMAVGMGGVGKMLTQGSSVSASQSAVRSTTLSGRHSAVSSEEGSHPSSAHPSKSASGTYGGRPPHVGVHGVHAAHTVNAAPGPGIPGPPAQYGPPPPGFYYGPPYVGGPMPGPPGAYGPMGYTSFPPYPGQGWAGGGWGAPGGGMYPGEPVGMHGYPTAGFVPAYAPGQAYGRPMQQPDPYGRPPSSSQHQGQQHRSGGSSGGASGGGSGSGRQGYQQEHYTGSGHSAGGGSHGHGHGHGR